MTTTLSSGFSLAAPASEKAPTPLASLTSSVSLTSPPAISSAKSSPPPVPSLLRANGGSDLHSADTGFLGKDAYQFYHIKNPSQLRMDDLPKLLAEYKQLPSD
uniref:Uncharacterized protein n=1 Tax=Fagus sylvatica TaxID=28930 RepID=A0A2N9EHT7_FAGSY